MRTISRPRGFSWVSFLLLVLLAGAGWWGASYGSAYLDNIEIKSLMHEAANLSVHEKNDEGVRQFILKRMSQYKDLVVAPEDVQIQRTDNGHWITIDVTYTRTVKPLFTGDERVVSFSRHLEQDIAPVKW